MLTAKLSRAIGIMSKLKFILPTNILKQLYFAFFHSHLVYGLNAWSATYNTYLKPIKTLQIKHSE